MEGGEYMPYLYILVTTTRHNLDLLLSVHDLAPYIIGVYIYKRGL